MRRTLLLVVALAAFWLLLSGHYTALLLTFAVASILLVLWVTHRMGLVDHEHPGGLNPRVFAYFPWLGWQVLVSGARVMRLVWTPRLRLDPKVGTTSVRDLSVLGQVIYANSITLTPGTLSLRVADDGIEVHALEASGLRDLDEGAMVQRVRGMESRH